MTELSIDELRARLDPLKGYVGHKIRHIKSGNWYRVTDVHFREADMAPHFTYETCHREPIAFSRPIGELLDGRFELSS